MSIGLAVGVRNDRLGVIRDAIDAGADAGTLTLYKGVRPATGGAPGEGDLIAVIPLLTPCASIDAGVMTFLFGDEVPADASATPTWGRFADSDGTAVLDGSVGEGELIQIDTVSIYAGGLVSVVSASLIEGNP